MRLTNVVLGLYYNLLAFTYICYVYSISKFMLAICKIIYIIKKSEVVKRAFDFVGRVPDRNQKHIVIFIFIVKSSLSWISF